VCGFLHQATLGFDSTAGYFGINGGTIKLPGQLEVYPIGASLDAKRCIQLDSIYEQHRPHEPLLMTFCSPFAVIKFDVPPSGES
jgi:hypothetical protein